MLGGGSFTDEGKSVHIGRRAGRRACSTRREVARPIDDRPMGACGCGARGDRLCVVTVFDVSKVAEPACHAGAG